MLESDLQRANANRESAVAEERAKAGVCNVWLKVVFGCVVVQGSRFEV